MPSNDTRRDFSPPLMAVGIDDVRTALAAGFSEDEVAYMLDLERDAFSVSSLGIVKQAEARPARQQLAVDRIRCGPYGPSLPRRKHDVPRFFFHYQIAAQSVRDPEGSELADLDAARDEAVQNARDLMGEAARQGFDISHRTYQICDADGLVLMTLPFVDALTRQD